ncbi:MAG: TonB-dependent receptor [Spirochaetota bacterium]|nr:TonB-dependent receptor [Spirochaetota bacterium]
MINYWGKIFTALCIVIIFSHIFIILTSSAYAQNEEDLTLRGKVYNSVTKKPPDFATVIIIEAKVKVQTDYDGSYEITVPEPGEYTVIVRSSGLKKLEIKITINRNMTRDFRLRPISIKGVALTITEERDIQKLSRQTLSARQLKEMPASFGDAINALASLPGIIRSGGFEGPLVIRGADVKTNNYFIDDIPIYHPLHYGGMHSVINNNIMSEIDLYASSFSAEFGSAIGAVININTVDDVKEFSGYADIALLSANFLIQTPILRDKEDDIFVASPTYEKEGSSDEKVGYFIASGRYGYFGLLMPIMMQNDDQEVAPEYWDYQAKCKYYINSSNSVTLLFMGNKDFLRFKQKKDPDPGSDPLLQKLEFKMDQMSHSQGIYYTFQPSKKIKNKLLAYSSLKQSYFYFNSENEGVADYFKDYNMTSNPYIFGLKDKTEFEWWENHATLRTAVEYTIYYFKAHGKSLMPRGYQDVVDPADPELFYSRGVIDERIVNHVIGGYAENKFTFARLTVQPGIRSDYLKRSDKATLDPRIMASYEFPTDTTISAAGGRYSYFFQTNPFIFDQMPELAEIGEELKPEKAIHRAVGIEQKIGLFTVSVEGFNNKFYDKPEAYPHTDSDGSYLQGLCTGKVKTYGTEIMLRKDRMENQDGLFGWLSYTYTHSRYKSGLPTQAGLYGIVDENGDYVNPVGDPYGDQWFNYYYEQRHSLKLIAGYVFGSHTVSGRFQFYSSFPYTPIIGSEQDTDYYNRTGLYRYVPITGKRNSAHFRSHHTLDIRYSYKIHHSWGYVNWYVEVINVYNNVAINEHKWDYRIPYSEDNPHNAGADPDDEMMVGIYPNFGVEVKF